MSSFEKNMENRPAFTAQLPPAVRYCNELSSTAKLLFAEVSALCLAEGFCWASNGYFGDLFGISSPQISRLLRSLSEADFIEIKRFRERANYREIHMLPAAFSGCNSTGKQVDPPIDKKRKGVAQKRNGVLRKSAQGIAQKRNGVLRKSAQGIAQKRKPLIGEKYKEKYKGKGTPHFSSEFSSKPRPKSFDQIDREEAAAFTKNSIAEFLADQGVNHVAN